jgi:glycosyltransferase involved in cell wall biosynthesis
LGSPTPRPRVFVHLAHGSGAETWAKSYDRGSLIGLNYRSPYGYHLAEPDCEIQISADRAETPLKRIFRLGCRACCGFDLVHAWHNRSGIYASDVVWTHTESQHLAVAALLLLAKRRAKPMLIAQSVWLFDRWHRYSRIFQALFRTLMNRADVLTVHSPLNLKVAQEVMPHKRCELVLYGIRHDLIRTPREPRNAMPLRLLAVGNDRDRDWNTLAEAFDSLPRCELRIVSDTIRNRRISRSQNISVINVTQNDQLLALYDWADIAIVPLRTNLHASGITAIQEAVLQGVPVVCTGVGGLTAYFSEQHVKYVPPNDPGALRRTVLELGADTAARFAQACCAQAAMASAKLSASSFVHAHIALSAELMSASVTPVARPGRAEDTRSLATTQ